jgi:hypothetical protein
VALSIEASLQQRFPLNNPVFYVLLFFVTVLYYTKAYVITETPVNTNNERSLWYVENNRFVKGSQTTLTIISVCIISWLLKQNFVFLTSLRAYEYILIAIVPLVSLLYYGASFFGKYNLRNLGLLKPFIIGFVWAGLVNVYPVMYYNIVHGQHYQFTVIGCLLFIKNMMYVTVLCIMFDIKDYAMDYNQRLKTFVVKAGLRKTLYYIIFPLTLLGLNSFLIYASLQHFHLLKILLNTVPFLCILLVAVSLHRRKTIFYYLSIIDGLMLLKAICGIVAMRYA